MLILTRKIGKKIIIGNSEIEIHILKIGRSFVKVGVLADVAVSVHREEIFERIQRETQDKKNIRREINAIVSSVSG